MKFKRYAILALLGVALVIGICFAFQAYWQRKQPVFDAAKLMSALQGFAHDREARGQPLPASLNLQDLISGKYLGTNDVVAFQGVEVTFSTTTDETRPQDILARAHLPNDSDVVLLGDGSAQVLAPDRLPASK